jgi:hypothetical protein
MGATLQHTDPMLALSRAHAALDELQDLELTGLSEEALLGYWRELERLRRRLPSVEHGLVLEAETRGLAFACQARSTAAMLRAMLRLDAGEAAARVRAAEAAGSRRTLTGQPLPPIHPVLAAAQAARSVTGTPRS